jgi:hypothetical protein
MYLETVTWSAPVSVWNPFRDLSSTRLALRKPCILTGGRKAEFHEARLRV